MKGEYLVHAEIITIGTELMRGEIVNGNAAFLAERFVGIGIDVSYQTAVGDEKQRLLDSLQQALRRSDIVVCTGGLGPTEDDLTRYVLAEVTGRPLVEHEQAKLWLHEWLRQRQKSIFDRAQLRQCLLPLGAEPLLNPIGSAPGIGLAYGRKLIVALPGPPHELSAVWQHMAENWIVQKAPMKLKQGISRQLMICGLGESDVNERLRDLMRDDAPVQIAPYARPGLVRLRLSASGDQSSLEELHRTEQVVMERLGHHVYDNNGKRLEQTVGELLVQRGQTIAFAESCTGGLLGARMTDIAGCSQYFLGSLVCYSNQLKTNLLGVDAEIIAEHGAVSGPTAAAMAAGALRVAGSDISCSVTGVAGPGASEKKPAGTVWFGLAHRKREGSLVSVWKRFLPGDRQLVRERSVQEVFTALYFYLKEGTEGSFWRERDVTRMKL